ncbi:MAG TPA: endonuclease III [Chthoniobacterales bacterium]
MVLTERANALLTKLREVYPDAHCELNFSNPLELLVATILSAQCTDKRVNLVTPALFQKYRSAADYATAAADELEREIQSTGFFRAKARNIRSMARDLVEKHQGEVPASMSLLTELAGVGRKTANVVLGNAFHRTEGIVVDTHVARLAGRLKLSSKSDPEKIERDLLRLVPREHWTMFSHWLIWHGRRRCYARNPDCLNCEVAELCPSRGRPDGKAGRPLPAARVAKGLAARPVQRPLS